MVVGDASVVVGLWILGFFADLGDQPVEFLCQPTIVVALLMLARCARHDAYGTCIVFHALVAIHRHGLRQGGESIVAIAGEMLQGSDGGLPHTWILCLTSLYDAAGEIHEGVHLRLEDIAGVDLFHPIFVGMVVDG